MSWRTADLPIVAVGDAQEKLRAGFDHDRGFAGGQVGGDAFLAGVPAAAANGREERMG
jgi:hypothetical protein